MVFERCARRIPTTPTQVYIQIQTQQQGVEGNRRAMAMLLLLMALLLLVAAWHVAAGIASYRTAAAHAARR
jgi:cell division protein FtsB